MRIDPSKFDGDGKRWVEAQFIWPGTLPAKVTKTQARKFIEEFRGLGQYSSNGSTVWVVLEYLHINELAYTIHVLPQIEGHQDGAFFIKLDQKQVVTVGPDTILPI